jgi:hypothetical protein
MVSDPADRVELGSISEAIVRGVQASLPGWVERQVARILDAWGRLDAGDRERVDIEARAAGRAATDRVSTELDALFAVEPVAQRTTPLEIVRTAYREPTAVLRGAGVPEVVRDAFDERAWPDDGYGLVPRTFADLDDEALAPLHLAWGLAKAKVLREQRTRD